MYRETPCLHPFNDHSLKPSDDTSIVPVSSAKRQWMAHPFCQPARQSINPQGVGVQQNEAGRKWPPFGRWYFPLFFFFVNKNIRIMIDISLIDVPRVELTISQHWFRSGKGLGPVSTSVKYRSRVIGSLYYCIALKVDKRRVSTAAEMPVKF